MQALDSLLIIMINVCVYVSAVPLPDNLSSAVRIVRYENKSDGRGNYIFRFETSDGTKREETGTLINPGQSDAYVAVVGSYSFRHPDGSYENVEYSADKNGYKIINLPNKGYVIPEIPIVTQAALPSAVVASLLG